MTFAIKIRWILAHVVFIRFLAFSNSCVTSSSSVDIGTCAITAIPFEKSKVLFGLEEMEEFSLVDETDAQATAGDLGRSAASLEKWGWIMFECGIENLTVKGKSMQAP